MLELCGQSRDLAVGDVAIGKGALELAEGTDEGAGVWGGLDVNWVMDGWETYCQ